MNEIIDQVQGILRGVWRFRWIALGLAWVLCLLAWPVVLILPDKYEASSRVFVDPRTALKPVIEGLAIEQDLDTELNLVRQSLLGAPYLKRIIAETGLAPKVNLPQNEAQAINALRSRINIVSAEGAGAQQGDGPASASKIYTITYQDISRDRALQVVQTLLDTFKDSTLGGKRAGSAAAQKFVQGQIAEYEARLREAEQRLADFKKKNMGMVPGDQQSDYFTRLQMEIDAVKKTQTLLSIAYTRRSTLEQQLRGEAPVAASVGGSNASGVGGAQGGDTLSRIKETQARLEDTLLRYTDKHPDVIALRETLEQLKARRAQELEALRRGDAGAAASTGASLNPVYQSIQLALNQTSVEIAGLRGELSDHERKVAELRLFVDTMPQVEAEFARLNRDYTVTKAQYTALVDRLEKARLGEEAEATGSVRFEVIDPPTVGFKPVSPKRTMLLAAILMFSLAVGAGLAYLLNLLKPVFHNAGELADLTGLKVLGVVRVNLTTQAIAMRRQSYLTYSLACALLVVMLVVVVFIGMRFSPFALSGLRGVIS
jgi:polysaccharide chain length determinant protein (PEP-CTERM system associated)